MTLEQSVNLIEHALINGKHNEIIIPDIYSMRIIELFSIFESKYNKKTIITGLRCKEKIHEDLISESEAKMAYKIGEYYHIGTNIIDTHIIPFSSNMKVLDKHILESYLISQNLI